MNINQEIQPLLLALKAAKNGDFSVRLPLENNQLDEVAEVFNEWVGFNQKFFEEIVRISTQLGEGKLQERISPETTNGLWASSIDGINKLIDNLVKPTIEVERIISAIARGDLSQEIATENVGEFQQLTDSVNQMNRNLRISIQQVAEVATAVASASEEFTAVSKEMTENAIQTAEQATAASASAEQVSKNATTVAISMEQMSASIKEIAKNAALGAKVATEAVQTANDTNITISRLSQSSVEIGKVIKVITSIAQQTNLLALNATIEAARAGDAGRGFAVVASEVKELAKQTAKSSEDINQRIEAIQTDTKGVIDAITQITVIINEINEMQNTIASAVEEQTMATNEISRNISEAANGTSDIAKNIGVVALNAQSTTIGASNTSQAASELSRVAVDLQKVISKFKY